ncbi:MAG: adenylate/guanylate cyclase domain-containing protein [Alphaproteobacteria bacterium]|nr:adenylate/guanylate cyclase domain-containing protein [Alphaproteobacteria bacterium]
MSDGTKPDGSQRKLAAIVFADVVGYSRLMGADEEGTFAALKAHRNAIDPVIFSHGGRIVKTIGDGLLIEYPTVVAAAGACLQIQKIMAERDAMLPADRRMQFRIGVHVGEVIVDGDDIFGDTVNIAARLQELAEPGGIALSGAARDVVHRHVDASMIDLGPQSLKNIVEAVQVWRIDMGDTKQAGLQAAAARPKQDRSAIAVLPFDNMSNDPEQEYFVDGITEDLITALSLIRDLKVIARNSTFAYKGKAKDIKLIARELDARYVLEGSVRKASNRVRITGQLVDAANGQHMWAERFDRDLSDIFDLQDEITSNIASRVAPTLRRHEIERARQRSTSNLDTWDMYLRMLHHYYRYTKDDTLAALDLCDRIKAKDTDFAPAYYYSAMLVFVGGQQRFVSLSAEVWQDMLRSAERGVALAGDDYHAHAALSWSYSFSGRHEEALHHGRQSLNLNSYAPLAWMALGMAQWANGDHADAAGNVETAWRLGTNDPMRFHFSAILSFVHFQLRKYDAALSWADQCLKLRPTHVQVIGCRAAALAQLDRLEEAQTALVPFTERFPGVSASRHLRNFRWRLQEDIDHYSDGLRKAGLPE